VTEVEVTFVSVPQAAPEHPVPERDQVTPLFCESFCTEAVKLAAVEVCTEVEAGLMDTAMGRTTVKLLPLLTTPPTVTTTLPVVAPVGTGATMLVALQLVAVAAVPLNLTVLVPCEAPKFAPVIVTLAPTNPDVGFKLVMLGGGTVTVKVLPLLATPPTVTTTFPAVAPVGTVTTMLVELQLVAVAAVPLNVTVLVPCEAPKFAPVIVTLAPTNPEVGFKLVMLGVESPPPGLVVFAGWTTPAHPAKVMPTTARTQNTTTHKRVCCEFAAERIVVNIIFLSPDVDGASKLRPSACAGRPRLLAGTQGGNWTSDEKEGRCVSATFTVLKGKLGSKLGSQLSSSKV
jgi:hypothetical protein